MTKRRSTFRRHPNRNRGGGTVVDNTTAIAYRDRTAYFDRLPIEDRKRITENARAPVLTRSQTRHQSGETGRMLASRLRTEAANTTVEAPAKPKRVRTKKVAA